MCAKSSRLCNSPGCAKANSSARSEVAVHAATMLAAMARRKRRCALTEGKAARAKAKEFFEAKLSELICAGNPLRRTLLLFHWKRRVDGPLRYRCFHATTV
jgi:hypothetical protein